MRERIGTLEITYLVSGTTRFKHNFSDFKRWAPSIATSSGSLDATESWKDMAKAQSNESGFNMY